MPWPVTEPTFGDYNYLRREVGIAIDAGANPAAWNHEQQGVINSIVQRGVRNFYTPICLPGERSCHEWSFLRPLSTLTTTAPYTTGTISATDGVVTLSGGTWPAAAASGELMVNGVTYTVNTRDNGTQLTLDDLTVDITAGTTFSLLFPQYELPADFALMYGPLTYAPGLTVLYPPIEVVSEHQIRTMRQSSDVAYRPTMSAIRPRTLDQTTGTRWDILFWPIPDAAYILSYRYRVNPADLTTTNKFPYGGQPHYATIVASVLREAELYAGVPNGPRTQDYVMRLKASVDHDRVVSSPKFLGVGRDRSDIPVDPTLSYHDFDANVVNYVGYTP